MRVLGTKSFTDRYPFFGPAVWMLAVTFFVAQLVVAYPWRSKPPLPEGVSVSHPYSFFANSISDLGVTTKYQYGTPPIWSPWHVVMNLALVLLGVVMILGSVAIYQEFTETGWRMWLARIGFGLQAVGGLGVILVGLHPENSPGQWHLVGAALAIAVGSIGVFVLSWALPLPPGMQRFMRWGMPLALVAVLLLVVHEYLGFGGGGMERIATYPEVIWLIAFGFYISKSHYFHQSLHRVGGHTSPTS